MYIELHDSIHVIMTCALFDFLTYAIFYFDRLCLTAKSGNEIRYHVFKLQTDSVVLGMCM